MESAVLHNILKLLFTFGPRGGARPATVTLANLVAFAFFPVFILKLSTIDCEHEHYSKIKQGPVSCVDSIGLPREVSLRGLPEFWKCMSLKGRKSSHGLLNLVYSCILNLVLELNLVYSCILNLVYSCILKLCAGTLWHLTWRKKLYRYEQGSWASSPSWALFWNLHKST